MNVVNKITDLIGNTPIIKLSKIGQNLPVNLFVKLEYFNPGGSVKDRIGWYMLTRAEKDGKLKPGGTIIEATAGNTGIGLAITAIANNYKMIFVIPDKMSQEKVEVLKALGAKVILTRSDVLADHPEYYSNLASTIQNKTPNSIYINQFNNPMNPEAHYKTTGPEIWNQMAGEIDVFVTGVGTGGTISGCGKFLKEKNHNLKIVLADPEGSILSNYINTGKLSQAKSFLVEGIGEDYIPSNFNTELVDFAYTIDDKEAFAMSRRLLQQEGIFAGTSAGVIMCSAIKYAMTLTKSSMDIDPSKGFF